MWVLVFCRVYLNDRNHVRKSYGRWAWDNINSLNVYNIALINSFRHPVISFVSSLRPCDAIWRHGSGSMLAQALACCLRAPHHYLNQNWLIINKTFTSGHYHKKIWRYQSVKQDWFFFKVASKSPRGQWVDTENMMSYLFMKRLILLLYSQFHRVSLTWTYIDHEPSFSLLCIYVNRNVYDWNWSESFTCPVFYEFNF